MAQLAKLAPLPVPGGSPALLGPASAPLFPNVLNRNVGQRVKRRHATMMRRVAFQIKSRAFPGKIDV